MKASRLKQKPEYQVSQSTPSPFVQVEILGKICRAVQDVMAVHDLMGTQLSHLDASVMGVIEGEANSSVLEDAVFTRLFLGLNLVKEFSEFSVFTETINTRAGDKRVVLTTAYIKACLMSPIKKAKNASGHDIIGLDANDLAETAERMSFAGNASLAPAVLH
jgi:hypothetical protein